MLLENKISVIVRQLVTTSIGSGRLCRLSILLIALIGLCFILTTVPITKRAVKGQRAGMSNGSKSVNDGCSGQEEEQSEKENMHTESCIAFSQLHNHLMFLILVFSRLAPPSGLRGSCVEAIFLYVTCL